MRVYYSNTTESLLEKYEEQLMSKRSLFAKRWLVLPSPPLNRWMREKLADHLSVASLIETLSLHQMIERLIPILFEASHPFFLPNRLELTLRIEKELATLDDPEIKGYLEGHPSRRLPLCQKMAGLFESYGFDDPSHLTGWQKKLWEALYSGKERWEYPSRLFRRLNPRKSIDCDLSVDLFLFPSLPPLLFDLLGLGEQKMQVNLFQLSPCQEFWSDLASKKQSVRADPAMKPYLEEGHPLLANLGKIGRELAATIEKRDLELEELYVSREKNSCLSALQQELLTLQSENVVADTSVRLFSAATPFQEVSAVRESLIPLINSGINPEEILVVAPSIASYRPAIVAQFADDIPFQINDLTRESPDDLVSGIERLFDLEKRRYSAPALMELFSHPLFLKKQRWSEEDVRLMRGWVARSGIRWGVDAPHREAILHQPFEGRATWEDGIDRLLFALATDESIDFTQAERLGEMAEMVRHLYHQMRSFYDEKKRSLAIWMALLRTIVTTIFSTEELPFQRLTRAASHFPDHVYSFSDFEKLLRISLSEEQKVLNGHQVGGVRFGSLSSMRGIPARVICCMGLSEEAFPRKETFSSLDQLGAAPSRTELDRSAFLDLILSARDQLILTYQGRDPFDQSLIPPSSVVADLLPYIQKVESVHPSTRSKPSQTPLFRAKPNDEIVQFEDRITLFDYLRAFRAPIKHYLGHLGLFFGREERLKEDEEFTLSPFLLQPGVLEHACETPDFPLGSFGEAARHRLEKKQHELADFDFSEKEITARAGPLHVEGNLLGLHDDHLIVNEKCDARGAARALPLLLLVGRKEVVFAKDGEQRVLNFEAALDSFVDFYFLALQQPTPLYPELIHPLLTEDARKFERKIEESYDEALQWTLQGHPLAPTRDIISHWRGWAEKLYGRMLNAWL